MEGIVTPASQSTTSTTSTNNPQEVPQQQQQQADNKATQTSTSTTTTTSSANRHSQQEAIERFLNIYNHAVTCTQSPCTIYPTKCGQFRRLIAHTRSCAKIKINECDMCRQTIALTIIHAKSCRDEACSIPYCGSIKSRLDEMNEMRARVESAYEVVRAGLQLIASPSSSSSTLSTSVQTLDSLSSTSSSSSSSSTDTTTSPEVETSNETTKTNKSTAEERSRLLTEIERVKSLTSLQHRHNHQQPPSAASQHQKTSETKFSKELAKFIFKKSMTSHQLTDVCYKSVHFARLAKLFIQQNMTMIKQISSTSNTNNSCGSDLDDYLLLVIDLAHRFDTMLAKFTRRSVECQTESCVEKKRHCEEDVHEHEDDDDSSGDLASKRMRFV